MGLINTISEYSDIIINKSQITEQDIHSAESDLNLSFSEEYKQYLLEFGSIEINSNELTGLCKPVRKNVIKVTERYRNIYPNFPSNYYVVHDLGFDHIIIVQDESGTIYQYGPQDSGQIIYHSFNDYIINECI